MTMTTLPTDLITATVLHEIAQKHIKYTPLLKAAGVSEADVMEQVARDLLANIAHRGPIDSIIKAIAAAGGPANAGEIAARFKAVQDMHQQGKGA